MSLENCFGIAGLPPSLMKWTAPATPSAVLVAFCSLAANASAGGPIAADALKLRKWMSSATATWEISALSAIALAIRAPAAVGSTERALAITLRPLVDDRAGIRRELRRR